MTKKILSGNALKVIAVITMIIDHAGAILFPQLSILRTIGRISFPIFAFLICEGMANSKNQTKYMLRLAILAVISEPCYDFVFFGQLEFTHQNIFFTLLCGTLTIYVCEKSQTWIWAMMGIVVADLLKFDYAGWGVLLIVLFWYYRENKLQLYTCTGIFACCIIVGNFAGFSGNTMTTSYILWAIRQGWSLLAVPFLAAYNGKRGFENLPKKLIDYSFYAIYPVHLLIFLLIK